MVGFVSNLFGFCVILLKLSNSSFVFLLILKR
jgi:hypothetical protein